MARHEFRLKVNNHQLKAGGMKIGGLNRRLKEKTSKDGGFDHGPSATRAKAAAGTNKATGNLLFRL